MGMMLLDDNQFMAELNRFNLDPSPEVINQVKVVDIKRGRTPGRLEIPSEFRAEVAAEAFKGELSGKELADKFQVSQSSISAYKQGATSTASYNLPDSNLLDSNNEVKSTLTDSARSALRHALAEITPDKLSLAKVRDAAGIAKDMSAVMKNLEPTNPQQQNNVQVVIYKPRTKDEDSYEVISVNE